MRENYQYSTQFKRTFNSATSLRDYSALSFADLVIAVELDMRLVCGQTRNISEQIRRFDKSPRTCAHVSPLHLSLSLSFALSFSLPTYSKPKIYFTWQYSVRNIRSVFKRKDIKKKLDNPLLIAWDAMSNDWYVDKSILRPIERVWIRERSRIYGSMGSPFVRFRSIDI